MLEKLCKRVSSFLYKLMRGCELVSGDAKKIKEVQEQVEMKIQNVKNVESDLDFAQDNIISKEEHIERLYMFIEFVAINYRNEKFDAVDKAFKKINL